MMTPARLKKALDNFGAYLRKINRQLDQIIDLLRLLLEMMDDEQSEDD